MASKQQPEQKSLPATEVKAAPIGTAQVANVPAGRGLRAAPGNVVPYLNYGAERIGKTGIAGIALAVFSAFVFMSANMPLRDEVSAQADQLEQARAQGRQSRGGNTVATPEVQASRFVSVLPSPNDVPAILGTLVTVAAATGIELQQGSYDFVDGDSDAINRYEMTIPVVGTYPQVREFIEDVLAGEPSVTLDSMRLERSSVTDTVVAADLQFSILLRSAK